MNRKNTYVNEVNKQEFISKSYMHNNLKVSLLNDFKYLDRQMGMVERNELKVKTFLGEVSDKYSGMIHILRFCLNSFIISQDEFLYYLEFISDLNLAFLALDRTAVNAISFVYDFIN